MASFHFQTLPSLSCLFPLLAWSFVIPCNLIPIVNWIIGLLFIKSFRLEVCSWCLTLAAAGLQILPWHICSTLNYFRASDRWGSSFILWHVGFQFPQCHLLKTTPLTNIRCLKHVCSLSQILCSIPMSPVYLITNLHPRWTPSLITCSNNSPPQLPWSLSLHGTCKMEGSNRVAVIYFMPASWYMGIRRWIVVMTSLTLGLRCLCVNYNILNRSTDSHSNWKGQTRFLVFWHLCRFVQLNSLVFLVSNTDVTNTAENAGTLNMQTSLTFGAVTSTWFLNSNDR